MIKNFIQLLLFEIDAGITALQACELYKLNSKKCNTCRAMALELYLRLKCSELQPLRRMKLFK